MGCYIKSQGYGDETNGVLMQKKLIKLNYMHMQFFVFR